MTKKRHGESADVITDEFLEKIRQELGVSDRFVEQARPAVKKVFTEVPEERQKECLAILRSIFECQAETETKTNSALETLEKLIKQLTFDAVPGTIVDDKGLS